MLDGLTTLAIVAALALLFIVSLAAGGRAYRAMKGAGADDKSSTGAGYLVGAAL